MSEANHWTLTPEEISLVVHKAPVGEWPGPGIAHAQYDKLAWSLVDWMFTHETDGSLGSKLTSGGRAWAERLVTELQDGGFTRPSS